MTHEATPPTPVSPKDLAAARNEYDEAKRFLASDEGLFDHSRRQRAIDQVIRLTPILHQVREGQQPAPPDVDTLLDAAPPRAERIEAELVARRAQLAELPATDPRTARLIDEISVLTNARKTTSELYSRAEINNELRTAGLDAEGRQRVYEAFTRLGLPPVEQMRFGMALSNARPGPETGTVTDEELQKLADEAGIDPRDLNATWRMLTESERGALDPYLGDRDVLRVLARYGRTRRRG